MISLVVSWALGGITNSRYLCGLESANGLVWTKQQDVVWAGRLVHVDLWAVEKVCLTFFEDTVARFDLGVSLPFLFLHICCLGVSSLLLGFNLDFDFGFLLGFRAAPSFGFWLCVDVNGGSVFASLNRSATLGGIIVRSGGLSLSDFGLWGRSSALLGGAAVACFAESEEECFSAVVCFFVMLRCRDVEEGWGMEKREREKERKVMAVAWELQLGKKIKEARIHYDDFEQIVKWTGTQYFLRIDLEWCTAVGWAFFVCVCFLGPRLLRAHLPCSYSGARSHPQHMIFLRAPPPFLQV